MGTTRTSKPGALAALRVRSGDATAWGDVPAGRVRCTAEERPGDGADHGGRDQASG
jgi:hypothetical protein